MHPSSTSTRPTPGSPLINYTTNDISTDDGDVPNIDAAVEQAWNYDDGSPDFAKKRQQQLDNELKDLQLARQLQEEEDQRMAARIEETERRKAIERQNLQSRRQQVTRNQAVTTGNSTSVDSSGYTHPKKKKQQKDCVLM